MKNKSAAWYRKAAPAARASDVAYIRDSVKLIRKFYDGFDAGKGYNLSLGSIQRMTPKKIARIREKARQIRVEQSAAHVVVRPRTRTAKLALEKHTAAPKERGRKAFIVHVPNEKTTARVETKGGVARVVEVSKKTGAASKREYFYFSDYGKREPKTMKGVFRMAEKIIDDIPDGLYVMVSRDYGFIGAPMFKSQLLREIERNWSAYDKFAPAQKDSRGLASSLIGFARVSTTLEGAEKEYNDRLTRRMKYQRAKRREYESKQAKRRAQLTGRR